VRDQAGSPHETRQRHGRPIPPAFERFPDSCGVYAGTFDDPNWFEIAPETAKHIFIDVAWHDTILPFGVKAFGQHAMTNDGVPNEPVVFDQPRAIGRERQS
jgi:hypothetical protein